MAALPGLRRPSDAELRARSGAATIFSNFFKQIKHKSHAYPSRIRAACSCFPLKNALGKGAPFHCLAKKSVPAVPLRAGRPTASRNSCPLATALRTSEPDNTNFTIISINRTNRPYTRHSSLAVGSPCIPDSSPQQAANSVNRLWGVSSLKKIKRETAAQRYSA